MRTIIVLILFCAWPLVPFASERSPEPLLHERVVSLLDNELVYDLGFLWLDQVAVANFKLQKSLQPGIYIGSLSAKTVGMAAPLTGYRKQQYVSMMKLMPDGRFRSVRHTSQKEKGGVLRAKVYEFDYERGEVTYLYYKNNKLITRTILPLDREREPSDIITAYYNLVSGAYGPQEVGAHYEIPAYNRRGPSDIVVDFIPSETRPKASFFPEDLLICRVVVDQDVFDTKDGVIYIGYDAQLLPARGIVTDMIGLGDVRGILR
ncbi:MAG: hypothetical protein C0623_07130 [Desulfuromonas sp.]|nr:MAG: hypothetical protein C0623_07130 [Desulfuromonas sp.]